MTHKQFKQILNDTNIGVNYEFVLIQLERCAWMEKAEDEKMGLDAAARYEARRAQALHDALEAAGVYDKTLEA